MGMEKMWKTSQGASIGAVAFPLAAAAALALVALLALAALPSGAAAQERSLEDGWWEWALPDLAAGERLPTSAGRTVRIGDGRRGLRSPDHRERAVDRRLHRDRLRWERRVHRQRGGPFAGDRGAAAFCRSGAGHPVFGRSWCRGRGFGVGADDVVWRPGSLEEIIFRAAGRRGGTLQRRGGILEDAQLIELLGETVLRQLLTDAHPIGRRGPVSGRWLSLPTGGSALQLRSGGLPLAELSDLEGDGRVDALLVAELLTR